MHPQESQSCTTASVTKMCLRCQVLRTELRLEESETANKELRKRLEGAQTDASKATAEAESARLEAADQQSSGASSEIEDSDAIGPDRSRYGLPGAAVLHYKTICTQEDQTLCLEQPNVSCTGSPAACVRQVRASLRKKHSAECMHMSTHICSRAWPQHML